MKRMRIAGLCLVAVCAVFVLTSSAFAVEGSLEYGKCVAKAGGAYKTATCTKKAVSVEEHKFEWTPLSTAVKFTSAKKAETSNAVLESVKGTEISCKNEVSKLGEYGPTKSTEVKNVIGEFSGCEALGGSCQSGTETGKINTLKLHGEPGTVTKNATNEEKNIDGNDLRGQTSEFLAEFTCSGAPVLVRGGVVVKASAAGKSTTNKMLNKVTVEFVAAKPGKQIPEKWTPLGTGVSNPKKELITEFLEGKVTAAGSFEQSGQSLITIQKTVNKVKVELRQCKQNVC